MKPSSLLPLATLGMVVVLHGQQPVSPIPVTPSPVASPPASPPAVQVATAEQGAPADYVIGPGDVLAIVFWREPDMSVADVVVRPDGRISIPLLNDVVVSGLTPIQLR